MAPKLGASRGGKKKKPDDSWIGRGKKKPKQVQKQPGAKTAGLGTRLFNAVDRSLDMVLDKLEGKNAKPKKKPNKVREVQLKASKSKQKPKSKIEQRKNAAETVPRVWKQKQQPAENTPTSPKQEFMKGLTLKRRVPKKDQATTKKRQKSNVTLKGLTAFNKARAVFSTTMRMNKPPANNSKSSGLTKFKLEPTKKEPKLQKTTLNKSKPKPESEGKTYGFKNVTLKRTKTSPKSTTPDQRSSDGSSPKTVATKKTIFQKKSPTLDSIAKEEKKQPRLKKGPSEFQKTFERIKGGNKTKLTPKKSEIKKATLKMPTLRKVQKEDPPPAKPTLKPKPKPVVKAKKKKESRRSSSEVDVEIEAPKKKAKKKKEKKNRGFFKRKTNINDLEIIEDDELEQVPPSKPSHEQLDLVPTNTLWKHPSRTVPSIALEDLVSLASEDTYLPPPVQSIAAKKKNKMTFRGFFNRKKKQEQEKPMLSQGDFDVIRDSMLQDPEAGVAAAKKKKHNSFTSETSKALSEGLLALFQSDEPQQDTNQYNYLGGDSTYESFTLKIKRAQEQAPVQKETELKPPEKRLRASAALNGPEKKTMFAFPRLQRKKEEPKPKVEKNAIPMSSSVIIIDEPIIGRANDPENLLLIAENLKKDKLSPEEHIKKAQKVQQREIEDGLVERPPKPRQPSNIMKNLSFQPATTGASTKGHDSRANFASPEEYFKNKIKPKMGLEPAHNSYQSSLARSELTEEDLEDLKQLYGGEADAETQILQEERDAYLYEDEDAPDRQALQKAEEADSYMYGEPEKPRRKRRRRRRKRKAPTAPVVHKFSDASSDNNEYEIMGDDYGLQPQDYDSDDAYTTDNENEYLVDDSSSE